MKTPKCYGWRPVRIFRRLRLLRLRNPRRNSAAASAALCSRRLTRSHLEDSLRVTRVETQIGFPAPRVLIERALSRDEFIERTGHVARYDRTVLQAKLAAHDIGAIRGLEHAA